MKSETLSLKIIKNELDFLKKTVIIQCTAWKEKIYCCLQANLEKKKILDPRNAEEHQSFLRKKNRKSAKQSDIITYQPKTFENPSIVDVKSVITEHSKNLHKLSKTIRKSEKLGSNSSLYSDTKKNKFWKHFERK